MIIPAPVFKSPVERLQKDWQLDWTDKGCNWTAVAGCMVLGEVHRVVQDQLCNGSVFFFLSNL